MLESLHTLNQVGLLNGITSSLQASENLLNEVSANLNLYSLGNNGSEDSTEMTRTEALAVFTEGLSDVLSTISGEFAKYMSMMSAIGLGTGYGAGRLSTHLLGDTDSRFLEAVGTASSFYASSIVAGTVTGVAVASGMEDTKNRIQAGVQKLAEGSVNLDDGLSELTQSLLSELNSEKTSVKKVKELVEKISARVKSLTADLNKYQADEAARDALVSVLAHLATVLGIFATVSLASGVASAIHGYKRNKGGNGFLTFLTTLWWFNAGYTLPGTSIGVAIGQGWDRNIS